MLPAKATTWAVEVVDVVGPQRGGSAKEPAEEGERYSPEQCQPQEQEGGNTQPAPRTGRETTAVPFRPQPWLHGGVGTGGAATLDTTAAKCTRWAQHSQLLAALHPGCRMAATVFLSKGRPMVLASILLLE